MCSFAPDGAPIVSGVSATFLNASASPYATDCGGRSTTAVAVSENRTSSFVFGSRRNA